MKKFYLTFLIILLSFQVSAQTKFNDAVKMVGFELGFKAIDNSQEQLSQPEETLLNKFDECAKHDNLKNLGELDFAQIKSVDIVDMDKEGKSAITLQAWEFENAASVSNFKSILDRVPRDQTQFCVNKGGIIWWPVDNYLYVLSSDNYQTTFQYGEIRRVVTLTLSK